MIKEENMKLTKQFLDRYPDFPDTMTNLGKFTYYRTYSRLKEDNTRETWKETCKRAVEYNCSLVPTAQEEYELLFDNMFNLRQFLSGRTLWVGGTDVSKKFPMSNFNCSFVVMDKVENLAELFYLLMIGTGVGLRIKKDDVVKLPKFRTDIELQHKYYENLPSKNYTSLITTNGGDLEIVVGDSKEGWVQALEFYFRIHTHSFYKDVKKIIINYDFVRPKGTPLKTFGGTASGYESIKSMFSKIHKILTRHTEVSKVKLKPIDVLDMSNIIAENVVVGGVRRSAEVVLMDKDDLESIQAKDGIYYNDGDGWLVNKELLHRQMSNNTILYEETPTYDEIKKHMDKIRFSGEPGFMNLAEARRRFPDVKGGNPCMEILLDDKGLCNLTTLNLMGFIDNGTLDVPKLYEAQKLSVRSSLRMTVPTLELHDWDNVQKTHRLLGCSLTGWQDMVNALSMTIDQQRVILKELREVAVKESERYAKALGVSVPKLVTTVKPEGTLSLLPTVSSGVHYSHSPYYIRRVRINAHDKLVDVLKELDYVINPEMGQDIETANTLVIDFPVKAPEGITKYNVSAIEQLEIYKMFMEDYVQHNVSITVHVREHEWDEVTDWLYKNWNSVVAVSFLSLDDNFYQLAPYESITEEQYKKLIKKHHTFNLKGNKEFIEIDEHNESCESGACPIR
jgi:ribonucleoside-triphosphate reductase (thioredoxin)